jgi:dihydropteroate synthase/2-amino-4-hydroxy-6-hydroxymethyldihydropteridine diphosphokinase
MSTPGAPKLGHRELVVGLGSSSADAHEMLRRARACLRASPGFELVRTSAIYRSDALLPEGAPASWDVPYLNAACRLKLDRELAADEIVAVFKAIERELGRITDPKKTQRWAPRPIDLDLLAWGRADHASAAIQIPHAGLFGRPFALLPTLDCADLELEPDARRLATQWRYDLPERVPLRTRRTELAWPELVGILNLTPDSFSDGDPALDRIRVARSIERMHEAGARIIDVGAESTRPGATPLDSSQEIARITPRLPALLGAKREHGLAISLDSRHPGTISWAAERGLADWINDVEGFASPRMLELGARTGLRCVAMHSLGIPPRADRTLDPARDPVEQILEWGHATLERMTRSGIPRDRIVLDPGLGFGKTPAQNAALAMRVDELGCLPARLLVGHSRKRFLDPASRLAASERDLETAILSAQLSHAAVDYLRVHDPSSQNRALELGARLAP